MSVLTLMAFGRAIAQWFVHEVLSTLLYSYTLILSVRIVVFL